MVKAFQMDGKAAYILVAMLVIRLTWNPLLPSGGLALSWGYNEREP